MDLLKSALNIMLEWKEFGEVFDVLGVGVGGVFFGVENLKEKRKTALKLSSVLENQLFERKYKSPANCFFQRHNRESPFYFAPER